MAVALAAAERGWHVFPLRPDDKRPAVRDWENRATTDPARIRRCWSTGPYGIGVACGPSGLVVVDLDTPKNGTGTPPAEWAGARHGLDVLTTLADRHSQHIGATYTVATGRGGTHLYHRHPASGPALRNTAGTVGWLVDTRAHGGYVVAAGSTANGRPYTVTLDTDPALLPGWLAGLLAPKPLPAPGPVAVVVPVDRHGRYVAAAIRRQVAHLAAAGEGSRNHVLFTSAVALGQLAAGGALTDADVTAVLEPVALSVGLRHGEISRTISSGLRVGARNPRSLPTVGRAA
ncbi:bifunctional DNA primase/polymerase [Micromonospora sp. CPCC 206060]|uniref:bifunctional DNA primase/polymerase n=1 Tax=Micromonospora sp. CPCC 206060 TaxID=3122406 RepID=UPI002FF0071B